MSNVLDNDKQQQILALGRLGWSLRRIEQALAGACNRRYLHLWSVAA
jgi:hypothetical protein